jgi:hypothetical protein
MYLIMCHYIEDDYPVFSFTYEGHALIAVRVLNEKADEYHKYRIQHVIDNPDPFRVKDINAV